MRVADSRPARCAPRLSLRLAVACTFLASACATTSGLDPTAFSASFCGSNSQNNCAAALAGPATAPSAVVQQFGSAGYNPNVLLLADGTLLVLRDDNPNCFLISFAQGSTQAAWSFNVKSPCTTQLATDSGLIIALGGDAVRAFRPLTGAVIWSYQNAAYGEDGMALTGNKVVFTSTTSVLCLDADSGGLLWRTGPFSGDNGGSNMAWNPAIDATGNVYVTSASKVRRLSGSTGAVEWAADLGALTNKNGLFSVSTTTMFAAGGNALYALDGSSGAQKWRLSLNLKGWLSQSAELNGVLYFAGETNSGDDYLYAVTISTGARLWTVQSSCQVWSLSASTFGGGTLYFGTDIGEVIAVDPATGSQLWSISVPQPISWVRSPIILGPSGKLFVSVWGVAVYVFQVPPSPTATASSTASSTATPSRSATATTSSTASASSSGSATATSSSTESSTATSSRSATATTSSTASASSSGSATATTSSTASASSSGTSSSTASASSSASATASQTPSSAAVFAVYVASGPGSAAYNALTIVGAALGSALVTALCSAACFCFYLRQRTAVAPAKSSGSDSASTTARSGV